MHAKFNATFQPVWAGLSFVSCEWATMGGHLQRQILLPVITVKEIIFHFRPRERENGFRWLRRNDFNFWKTFWQIRWETKLRRRRPWPPSRWTRRGCASSRTSRSAGTAAVTSSTSRRASSCDVDPTRRTRERRWLARPGRSDGTRGWGWRRYETSPWRTCERRWGTGGLNPAARTDAGKHFFAVTSVTRFGQISPLWQKFTSPWQFFDGLFLVWQIDDSTWANLWHYWDNFHCCK